MFVHYVCHKNIQTIHTNNFALLHLQWLNILIRLSLSRVYCASVTILKFQFGKVKHDQKIKHDLCDYHHYSLTDTVLTIIVLKIDLKK